MDYIPIGEETLKTDILFIFRGISATFIKNTKEQRIIYHYWKWKRHWLPHLPSKQSKTEKLFLDDTWSGYYANSKTVNVLIWFWNVSNQLQRRRGLIRKTQTRFINCHASGVSLVFNFCVAYSKCNPHLVIIRDIYLFFCPQELSPCLVVMEKTEFQLVVGSAISLVA